MSILHRRPTTIEEYREFNDRIWANDSDDERTFEALPSDVIITPYGKSGTTWLQQIVHGLRSRGDMEFDDISRVVPWIEMSKHLDVDVHAPQSWQPRAFKSHQSWDDIPKGSRYIVSVRDSKDVVVSLYRFMEGWWFEPGSISIETYAREMFLSRKEGRGYWHHLLSWWPHRHDENVLLLCYEEMRRDLPRLILTVAQFIGCDLDEELMKIVTRQSSLDFMLAHKDRFDDLLIRQKTEAVGGLPPGSDSAKVRKGEVGSHRYELPPEISEALDRRWREEIEPVLGFSSYQALREALAEGK